MTDFHGFLIEAVPFLDALRNVSHFAYKGRDALRNGLGVVRMDYSNDQLTLVTTDRYMLAYQTFPCNAGLEPFTVTLGLNDVATLLSAHKVTHRRHGTETFAQVKIEDGKFWIGTDAAETIHPISDNYGFPQYWRNITDSKREREECAEISFSGAVLAKLAKIRIRGEVPHTVTMELHGQGKPAEVHIDEGPSIFTVTRKATS